MGLITNVDRLKPELAKRVHNMLDYCKEKNVAVIVIETLRTIEVQTAYKAQGRESLETVNDLRRKAGLWTITAEENKRTITNTMSSKHLTGEAVDIAPLKNGQVWWSAPQQVWEELGLIAETFGLDWCAGGYGQIWGKGWDSDHFELLANWPGAKK
jgi:D-alanyl-D-alanine carboxypeptidase.